MSHNQSQARQTHRLFSLIDCKTSKGILRKSPTWKAGVLFCLL